MANVGSADRILRFILGAILVIAPFLMRESFASFGAWRYVIVAAGVVLVATAAFRFCPAYRLLGIRTCPVPQR